MVWGSRVQGLGLTQKGPPTLGGVLDGFSNREGQNPLFFSLTAQDVEGVDLSVESAPGPGPKPWKPGPQAPWEPLGTEGGPNWACCVLNCVLNSSCQAQEVQRCQAGAAHEGMDKWNAGLARTRSRQTWLVAPIDFLRTVPAA